MSKIKIQIYWCEPKKEWHIINAKTGKFIQEFYDCDNFSAFFLIRKDEKVEGDLSWKMIKKFKIKTNNCYLYINELINIG